MASLAGWAVWLAERRLAKFDGVVRDGGGPGEIDPDEIANASHGVKSHLTG